MNAEAAFLASLKQYCDTMAQKARYKPQYLQYIANELFNFLNKYRYFKCNIVHTETPGSLQRLPIIILIGNLDVRYSNQTIPVSLEVGLPVDFPEVPPKVTLPYPANPSLKLQPHEYLMVNELRISYLVGWNLATVPAPSLCMLMNHIENTFMHKHPYFPAPASVYPTNPPTGYSSGSSSGSAGPYNSYPGAYAPSNPYPSAAGSTFPSPNTYAPGSYNAPIMADPAQEKTKLVSEFKRLMAEQNTTFITESKQTVSSLQKVEGMVNGNEGNLATKQLRLREKQSELEQAICDIRMFQTKLQEEVARSQNITITEDNVTDFVKPSTELHEVWLKHEAKRRGRDNCMQVLKKLYEDKSISLATFLTNIEKLATKEFVSIYKKFKIEGLIRREEKLKA